MHRELMRIGAAMAQMGEMVGNQMTIPPHIEEPSGVQMQLAKPHAFLVDQSGVRYMNEGGSYMEFCRLMLERDESGSGDSELDDRRQPVPAQIHAREHHAGNNKPQDWFDQGYLRQGETIEALARACGIDPVKLKATTERFNASRARAEIEDFHRGEREYDRFLGDHTHTPSAALGPVDEAPFYAVPIVPGDVGTFGGVVTRCTRARAARGRLGHGRPLRDRNHDRRCDGSNVSRRRLQHRAVIHLGLCGRETRRQSRGSKFTGSSR